LIRQPIFLTKTWTRRQSTRARLRRKSHMRVFVVACIAAAVIALIAVAVLNHYQEPVQVAFSTSGVRL
jgi:hypothetical protein